MSQSAVEHGENGLATLPEDFKNGQYIIALVILDRQGGMMPSARFATSNYFRGGWHPLGFIGIGETPKQASLEHAKFDNPAFENSVHNKVPEKLRAVKATPAPQVKPVTPWTSDPKVELINKDSTTLRFNLPRDAKGTLDLADTRLTRVE